MKITGIEHFSVEMKLAIPYTIAYETIEKTTNVFLLIKTNSPLTGYGCAAPDLEVSGETPQTVLKNMEDIGQSELKNKDPLRHSYIIENLKSKMSKHPSALAAIDMALFDILGKSANLPLWKLLGGYKNRIRTSITIGILSLKDTISKANEYYSQGFRCLFKN
jgi:L-alanine-DL-glutamate epimerase-like enolase superfamily enzyme